MQTKIVLQVKGAALNITLGGQAHSGTNPSTPRYTRTYGGNLRFVQVFPLLGSLSHLHLLSEPCILLALASQVPSASYDL